MKRFTTEQRTQLVKFYDQIQGLIILAQQAYCRITAWAILQANQREDVWLLSNHVKKKSLRRKPQPLQKFKNNILAEITALEHESVSARHGKLLRTDTFVSRRKRAPFTRCDFS